MSKVALVLSGGGARGAYEAGVMSYIRSQMPKAVREKAFDIITGCSVGAINAAFLASMSHQPQVQGSRLATLWRSLEEDRIYKRDTKALLAFINKSAIDFCKHLIWGVKNSQSHFSGLLDASPLLPFLAETIEWSQIQRNIRRGHTKALVLVATQLATGRCKLFVNQHPSYHYSGRYGFYTHPIRPYHVLASASIPFVFAPIEINGNYYTDGGLRLSTPVSPAIHLGADKVLAISLQSKKAHVDAMCTIPPNYFDKNSEKNKPVTGQMLGTIMGSLFLDNVDSDIEQINRINRLINWSEKEFGSDYLTRINAMLARNNVTGDIADRGLKRIELFKMQPSENLAELFVECFEKTAKSGHTMFEKILLRGLDMDSVSGAEFLSYLMFNKLYIHRLVDLGFDDAMAKHDELLAFFES